MKSGISRKPLLLVQCGIHAGEIDGKDAGLMLLRDIVKGTKGTLIDNVNLLFIPVLNVDGHERTSPFNRINQRGPDNMGWRTNAQNLNRDYLKLDTREIRSVMQVIQRYHPDLYFDIHVTDGADYIMEPYAKTMIDQSPELLKEFELLKKNNPEIMKSQSAVLEWFYKKTPFYDLSYLVYPVARIL